MSTRRLPSLSEAELIERLIIQNNASAYPEAKGTKYSPKHPTSKPWGREVGEGASNNEREIAFGASYASENCIAVKLRSAQ